MESEISTDSEPGFFIVHHKIKWSVTWRLIWHAQKQDRKSQILRSTPNTAPLICGAYNIQQEVFLTTA